MKRLPVAFIVFSIIILLSIIALVTIWPTLPSAELSAEGYSAIAAFFSVLVALMTLYILRYQVEATDHSERLKVKPHCLIFAQVANFDRKAVGLYLRNNGLGPAIIVEWSFTVNGAVLPEKNSEGLLRVLAQYHLTQVTSGMILPPTTSLGANQTQEIAVVHFEVGLTETNVAGRVITANGAMERLMKEVVVTLTFKSVYDEIQVITTHIPKAPGKESS